MGNNPSHSLAAAGATATLSNKMNEINNQLGIGDDGKQQAEVNVPKVIGCSNRQEQKQRHTDRQKEYEMKQKERTDRLKDIENKRGKAIHREEPDVEVSTEKDQEIKAKIAELKRQSLLRAKQEKPKKKGFFGGGSSSSKK